MLYIPFAYKNTLNENNFDSFAKSVKLARIMANYKVQAYDVSEKTKKAIRQLCKNEQRSESFIISRLLNKLFDPVEGALSPKNK